MASSTSHGSITSTMEQSIMSNGFDLDHPLPFDPMPSSSDGPITDDATSILMDSGLHFLPSDSMGCDHVDGMVHPTMVHESMGQDVDPFLTDGMKAPQACEASTTGHGMVMTTVMAPPKEDTTASLSGQGSPRSVVDVASLQKDMNRNKEKLKIGLQLRRPIDQLVEQGILPPLKSSPVLYEQRRKLERARMGDLLKHKIQHRPDRGFLVSHHILEDTKVSPSLHDKERLLKKARLADDLNDRLCHRPGPLELVKGNILLADEGLAQAIKEGSIHFKATSEGEIIKHPPPLFHLEEESSSDGTQSPPQLPPSTTITLTSGVSVVPQCAPSSNAPNASISSANSVTLIPTSVSTTPNPLIPSFGSTSLNGGQISISITNPFLSPFTTSTSSSSPSPSPVITTSTVTHKSNTGPLVPTNTCQESVSSTHKMTQKPAFTPGSVSSKDQRSHDFKRKNKLKSKMQPKARTIKFHEYKGPPNSQKNHPSNNTDAESSYELLLKQQQMFLQWQLECRQMLMSPKLMNTTPSSSLGHMTPPSVAQSPTVTSDNSGQFSTSTMMPVVSTSPSLKTQTILLNSPATKGVPPPTPLPPSSLPIGLPHSLTPTLVTPTPQSVEDTTLKILSKDHIKIMKPKQNFAKKDDPSIHQKTSINRPVNFIDATNNVLSMAHGNHNGPSHSVATGSRLIHKLEDLKVSDLKLELKKRNLPVSGSKPHLLQRLKPFWSEVMHSVRMGIDIKNKSNNNGSTFTPTPPSTSSSCPVGSTATTSELIVRRKKSMDKIPVEGTNRRKGSTGSLDMKGGNGKKENKKTGGDINMVGDVVMATDSSTSITSTIEQVASGFTTITSSSPLMPPSGAPPAVPMPTSSISSTLPPTIPTTSSSTSSSTSTSTSTTSSSPSSSPPVDMNQGHQYMTLNSFPPTSTVTTGSQVQLNNRFINGYKGNGSSNNGNGNNNPFQLQLQYPIQINGTTVPSNGSISIPLQSLTPQFQIISTSMPPTDHNQNQMIHLQIQQAQPQPQVTSIGQKSSTLNNQSMGQSLMSKAPKGGTGKSRQSNGNKRKTSMNKEMMVTTMTSSGSPNHPLPVPSSSPVVPTMGKPTSASVKASLAAFLQRPHHKNSNNKPQVDLISTNHHQMINQKEELKRCPPPNYEEAIKTSKSKGKKETKRKNQKSQAVDDVIDILIKSGEMSPSVQHVPITPTSTCPPMSLLKDTMSNTMGIMDPKMSMDTTNQYNVFPCGSFSHSLPSSDQVKGPHLISTTSTVAASNHQILSRILNNNHHQESPVTSMCTSSSSPSCSPSSSGSTTSSSNSPQSSVTSVAQPTDCGLDFDLLLDMQTYNESSMYGSEGVNLGGNNHMLDMNDNQNIPLQQHQNNIMQPIEWTSDPKGLGDNPLLHMDTTWDVMSSHYTPYTMDPMSPSLTSQSSIMQPHDGHPNLTNDYWMQDVTSNEDKMTQLGNSSDASSQLPFPSFGLNHVHSMSSSPMDVMSSDPLLTHHNNITCASSPHTMSISMDPLNGPPLGDIFYEDNLKPNQMWDYNQ